MEDLWLENEEFNFDVPLSPLDSEKPCEVIKANKVDDDDYEDEVFFGPVGHMERCAAVVVKNEAEQPLEPLGPAEQALALLESAKLSCLLKPKPLNALQVNSPVAPVYPFKRESSGIDIERLRSFRDKLASNDNKENMGQHGNKEAKAEPSKESGLIPSSDVTAKPVPLGDTPSNDEEYDKKAAVSPSPGKATSVICRRSSCGGDEKKSQLSRTAVIGASGIPKMPSKLARPSSIPSLKPGLLQGQARLRASATQDSKLKPMKAMRPGTALNAEPTKAQIGLPTKGNQQLRRTSLSSSFVTPKKGDERKHIRSNTAENKTKKATANLSTSQLQFSRPSYNSTPKQPPQQPNSSARRSIGSATGSLRKTAGSISTPAKTTATTTGKSPPSCAGKLKPTKETPNNKVGSSRRSLVPKPNQSQNETPLQRKVAQRRSSLLRYPNKMTSSPDKKTVSGNMRKVGNTSIARSCTFVLNDSKTKPKNDVSLIAIETQGEASNVVAVTLPASSSADCSPTSKAADMQKAMIFNTPNDSITPSIPQTDILVPEMTSTHASPLLKFDSPLPENTIADPFATGCTPPTLPISDGVLAPVQIEKNLIQF